MNGQHFAKDFIEERVFRVGGDTRTLWIHETRVLDIHMHIIFIIIFIDFCAASQFFSIGCELDRSNTLVQLYVSMFFCLT